MDSFRGPGEAHLNYTLAALVGTGGLIGYTKSRSRASLLAGLIIGGSYAFSGYLISTNQASNGFALSTATSAILTLTMGRRAIKTGKFMPAGLLTLIGLGGFTYNGYKYLLWNHKI